jgi:hypothetical protein
VVGLLLCFSLYDILYKGECGLLIKLPWNSWVFLSPECTYFQQHFST